MRLEVQNLTVGYARETPAQRNVTFGVSSGEVCCVLGPNGCGKSTLFRTMLGVQPGFGGRVMLDGVDIAKWDARRISSVMAYVSQVQRTPFPYKVKEVVLLGRLCRLGTMRQPRNEDYLMVETALKDLGIYELRNRIVSDLSGGERQLVMIARSMVQQPGILVLDEPTAALDYGNAIRVIRTVRALAADGYGILMATHDPDHAFMAQANVLLLRRDAPCIFGKAIDVITERGMRDAYGVGIRVVEYLSGETLVRRCTPATTRKSAKKGSLGTQGSLGAQGEARL